MTKVPSRELSFGEVQEQQRRVKAYNKRGSRIVKDTIARKKKLSFTERLKWFRRK